MPKTFNFAQKTIMICGMLVVLISGFLFALIATTFSAATFAALFFMMLVPVVTTALLTFFSDSNSTYPTVFRTGLYAVGIAYFLIGMTTAIIFLVIHRATGALFVLEFIYLILLGAALLLLGISAKSAGDKEEGQLRRVEQIVSLESRLRALKVQVAPDSPEAQGLDKIIDEVRYFDKNSVSQYDRGILEKLLDLESLLLTKEDTPLLHIDKDPEKLIDLSAVPDSATADPNAASTPPPPPPPVTESPKELVDDLYKLVVARHQDTVRTKRGGF
jgi:hypothetical protein